MTLNTYKKNLIYGGIEMDDWNQFTSDIDTFKQKIGFVEGIERVFYEYGGVHIGKVNNRYFLIDEDTMENTVVGFGFLDDLIANEKRFK